MGEREKIEEKLRQKRQELEAIYKEWMQPPYATPARERQVLEIGEQIKDLERELAGLDLLEECLD